MKKYKTIRALFSFPGFNALQSLQGILGDSKGRIIELRRQKKEPSAQVVKRAIEFTTIVRCARSVIWMCLAGVSMYVLSNGVFIVPAVEV